MGTLSTTQPDPIPARLRDIAESFCFVGEYAGAEALMSGHINDTYAVWYRRPGGVAHRYLLQRINHQVFRHPGHLMENIERVTGHIRERIQVAGGNPARETLTLIPTRSGSTLLKSRGDEYWRAALFIEGARTYQVPQSLDQVYQAGRAFGRFQELVSDYALEPLHETIPNFHHTQKRYEVLVEAIDRDEMNRAGQVQAEIAFVEQRAGETERLVHLRATSRLPECVTHNDTKLSNVMIDDETGKGICVIDLDTVMPGLALYDFGDAARSVVNPVAEDEQDLDKVSLDLDTFAQLTRGYLETAGALLTPLEIELLPFSAKLMTLECGIRFLTDYVQGDAYFRVHRPHQNLDRSRTQFKLVREMENHWAAMQRIVATALAI